MPARVKSWIGELSFESGAFEHPLHGVPYFAIYDRFAVVFEGFAAEAQDADVDGVGEEGFI